MAYQAALIFEKELSPKKGAKIPFGIHTECKVKSVEMSPAEYIDINFEDKEGRYHNKRLWWPNGKYPQEIKIDGVTRTETTQEAIAREEKERIMHIVRLMHIFLGEDELTKFPELDFAPFIEKAIKVLTPKLPTKLVNLKLIYDAEGLYSTIGNYPNYIELYVPGQEPKLAYTEWEKNNRCEYKGETAKSSEKTSNNDELDALFKPKQ